MADRELKVKIGIDLSGLKGDAAAAAREFEGIGKAATKGADDAQKSQSKLGDETAKQADKGGMAWAKVGPWIGTAVAAGAGIAVKAIVDLGMTYEQNLNQLQAVTGSTDAQMRQLGDTAMALGNDIDLPMASASDAAQAMLELAKGGLSADQAMRSAKGTLTLAAAAQISGAEAATIQSAALNTFGLSAESAGHVADVLANTANASSGEITDFAQGMAQAGLVANAMGVDIDGAAATLGIFANQGLSGSDAGTSLKTMLVSLQSPSKEAAGALADLGVTAFDASGNFVGMRTVTEQLSAAQATMTQQQFTAAASTAFGTDAVRAAVAMASQGVAGYDKMTAAVGRAGGAQEVAAAQTKGVTGALNNVKNQLENTALSIYQQYAPAIEAMLNGAADALPAIAGFFTDTLDVAGDFVGFIADLPGPVLILAGALTAVAVLKDPVSEVFGSIGAKMSEFKAKIDETAAAPAPLGAALSDAGVDADVLGEALGASSEKAKDIKTTGVGAAGAMTKLGAGAKIAGAGLLAAFGGPIGVTITILTAVISQVGSAMSDLELQTNDFGSAVDELTGKVSALKAIDMIDSKNAVALRDAGVSMSLYADALAGVPGAQEAVVQQLNAFMAASDGSFESMGTYTDLVKQFGSDLTQVGVAQDAWTAKTEAMRAANMAKLMTDVGTGMDGARAAAANAAPAVDGVAAGLDRVLRSAIDAKPRQDEINKAWEDGSIDATELSTQVDILMQRYDVMAGRSGDAEAAQRAFNASARDYTKALIDQGMEGQSLQQAEADLAAAQANRDDVQAHLNLSTENGGTTQAELDQANRDVTTSTADLAKAQADQGSKADDAAAKAAELTRQMLTNATSAANAAVAAGNVAGAHDAAAASVQRDKDAFIAMQSPADIASGKAQALADSLFGIPGNVATTIVANTQTADQQLSSIQSRLDAINNSTAVATVKVVQSLQVVGSAAVAAAKSILGGYTGGNIAALQAGGAIRGFAAGGSPGLTNIRGAAAPANPYEDNLLAFGADGRPLMVRSDEWLINGRVSGDLGPDIMANLNAGLYDRAVFEKASTTSAAYSTQGVYSATTGQGVTSSVIAPNIQVMLGTREITDIVQVVVDGTPVTASKWRAGQRAAARA